MLRNETKRGATMIGRITALVMVPASASGSVFEFDEEGIATRKPAINYLQRERLARLQSGAASEVAAVKAGCLEAESEPTLSFTANLGILPPTFDTSMPPEAITYIGLPEPKPARRATPQSVMATSGSVIWTEAAITAAETNQIPPHVFLALIDAESGFNAKAISPKGAIGLTQLMPATAKALGVDPTDPLDNLTGGARYLRQQFERFGNWPLALAAYNAGPTRVARLGRIPNIPETKAYVARVLNRAGLNPFTTASN